MGNKTKHYDETFKRESVRYYLENKKSVSQVSRELDVNVNTLHQWIKKYGEAEKKASSIASKSTSDKELQKRIRDLEEENEILKKAMHFFAKSPR